MESRAAMAARVLLLLSSFVGTASSMPFKRYSNSTVAHYSNLTSSASPYSIPLSTGASQTTSQITSELVSSSSSSSTSLSISGFSIPIVTLTTTDVQTTCPQSDPPSEPETTVVIVTETEEPTTHIAPATSILVVTQVLETTEGVTATPAPPEVVITSTELVEPSDNPGTFLVLVTSTQTVIKTQTISLPQPSATMTTTLEPSQPASGTPVTSVTVVTVLETLGAVTSRPYPTQNTVTSSVTPSALSQTVSIGNVGGLTNSSGVVDPFRAIATNAPPSQLVATGNHPVPTTDIVPQKGPLQTNKFYANLFLGDQMDSIFTHPYSVSWVNGSGATRSYGLAIQHIEASQRAFGPTNSKLPGSPASFFINPLGYQTIVMTAGELAQGTKLMADSLDTFSANAILQPYAGASSNIKFPLVQGMGFVTGIYTSLQPQIQTGVFFSKVAALGDIGNKVYKWRLSMNDGTTWVMYVVPSQAGASAPTFTLVSNALLQGPTGWSGTIHIAKSPAGTASEAVYDKAAGVYPTSASITGAVSGKVAKYSLSWSVGGKNTTGRSIVQYALPHHLQSFDNSTVAQVQKNMTLQTTTKGISTAVVGNSWTLIENNLPDDMGFAPWRLNGGTLKTYSSQAVNAIYKAAQVELQQNMTSQTDTNSMYFSGKALSKFASIVYAVNTLCNEPKLAQQGLQSLKTAMNLFTSNHQQYPLVYDTVWKGVVSSASYNGGDPLADFGNTYYNDHHFHYGYFLHTAAIIGSMDASWLASNRDWVNALARDVNNPSSTDGYFPVFRNYDWYHGHSWAKGLFESGDSKDEESTSEDVMFSYGLKMWGHVSGDASMEARGNLMLSVTARSLHNYFLMEDDNVNQPAQFIANRATGILFENKVDHTTYFGTNLEYIEGIHMLPLIPASSLTRRPQFVQQEWNSFFKPGAVDDAANVAGGWKGILYANLALIDPVSSFNFFNQDNFDSSWLDGGASRTWYLAMAAGLGGA